MCFDLKILDCEDYHIALESLSNIFELDIGILKQTLEQVDFSQLWENKYCNQMSFNEFMYYYFVKRFNVKKNIDKVCWFHLTRTLNAERYERGILPLGQVKEELFMDMYNLVSDIITLDKWKKIISYGSGGNNQFLYTEKTSNSFHYGPYGMLVKEVAFSSKELGNHDYLNIPEIIEDIAIGIESNFNINFTDLYLSHSYPIIVKFIVDFSKCHYDTTEPLIESALQYVYTKINNYKLHFGCNTCYDGKNTSIPRQNILYIERIRTEYAT